MGVETQLFPFPQHIIFLLCPFSKNGTSEVVRGEQELSFAKITMENTTHLGHTLQNKNGICFSFLYSLIKTDL